MGSSVGNGNVWPAEIDLFCRGRLQLSFVCCGCGVWGGIFLSVPSICVQRGFSSAHCAVCSLFFLEL
jgi:hypothetical protein